MDRIVRVIDQVGVVALVLGALAGSPEVRAAPPRAEVVQLLDRLEKGDERDREEAARRLEFLAAPEAVPRLLGLLGSADSRHRIAASSVLAVVAPAEARTPLVRALREDTDWEVRRNAAFGLGRLACAGHGNRALRDALVAAAADDHPRVRAAVARALGEGAVLAGRAAARRLAGDPDPEVRGAAAVALFRFDDAHAPVAARAHLTGTGLATQREFVQALGAIGRPCDAAARLLAPLLQDATLPRRLRADVATALAQLRDERGLRYLVLMSSSHDLEDQDEALRGLRVLDVGDARREALYRRYRAEAEAAR
jgi:HEAT repeat protein